MAFTQVEMVSVISVSLVLMAFAMAYVAKQEERKRLVRCANNVKQVGLAFKVWGTADEFSMHASTNHGGTKELIGTGVTFRHYLAMSNELGTPKVLLCPFDRNRTMATNWSELANTNLSYFVGVDASEELPNALLAGDRHLGAQFPTARGLLNLSLTNRLRWTDELHRNAGSVGLADGSVQRVDDAGLWRLVQTALLSSPTNRLEIP